MARRPPPPTPTGHVPSWAWISGGAGLAALGAGVGFAVDYASVRSPIARDCPDGRCTPPIYTANHIADQLDRWNRNLGLSMGLGAVGAGATIAAVVGIVHPRRDAPATRLLAMGGRPRRRPRLHRTMGASPPNPR